MTFESLDHCIGEDIIMVYDDPVVIAAEVSKLLDGLGPGYIFVVHRLAKEFAAAMAWELAFEDGDMVDVVRKHGAALEPIIACLQRHGVNGRSLRPAMQMSVGL